MKILNTALLLLGIMFFSKMNAQEKIYFPFFEMINVPDASGIQLSTSKLLKTYIEENQKFQIIIPAKNTDEEYKREDFLQSIKNAQENGAKYLLIGEINNIGKLAILSLSLYDVSSGNKIWSDMIKGLPLDDYDPVLSRIGRNFKTNTKAKDDGDLYDVTAYEEQREMKLLNFEANHFTGLALGGNYLLNETLNTKLGLNFFYDISSVILRWEFEYSSNTMFNFLIDRDWYNSTIRKNRTFNFSMNVSYPLTKTRNSFYLEGGLEMGILSQKDGSPSVDRKGSGLGINLMGGYLVGRNSTSNFRFYTGISIPTYKVETHYIPIVKMGIITSFANSRKKK